MLMHGADKQHDLRCHDLGLLFKQGDAELSSMTQGGGIFCNISSAGAPPKLRMLYECAPMAFIVEAAGGASSNGQTSILDIPISSAEQCGQILLGSLVHVRQAVAQLADAVDHGA